MPADSMDRQSGSRLGQVTVSIATEADRDAWETYVAQGSDDKDQPPSLEVQSSKFKVGSVSGYHGWAWRQVFTQTFGHECVYLAARLNNRGRIYGVLPLVLIKSWLFGRTLTSLPFVNYGGVVGDSEPVARALLDAAADVAKTRNARHVELRHTDRVFEDLPCKQHKVSMRLPLQAGMWEVIDRKVRNQIRKAEKSGLTVERGGAELVGDFYTVFTRNMRDLGTPVYSRALFDNVLRAFPDRARILVVRLAGAPIAAGLTFRTGTMVEVPWASSIREHNNLCPNHLLYWHVIESAVADGAEILDFGRSTPNEGTFKFKEQWGAVPVALHWEYSLGRPGGLPDQSPKNPKFRLMIEAWKRCPLWLANAVGPHIVRWIP
jgi:FemAB-related protein (PEP-CTERM system-associated)